MSSTSPTPAPLAQLRDVDPQAWSEIQAKTDTSNPHEQILAQALAASLMGHRDYAVTVLSTGFYPISVFPDLARPGNTRTVTLSMEHLTRIGEALDSAVTFATEEAERIENAPTSDGYSPSDIAYAKGYVVSITGARDEIAPILRNAVLPEN